MKAKKNKVFTGFRERYVRSKLYSFSDRLSSESVAINIKYGHIKNMYKILRDKRNILKPNLLDIDFIITDLKNSLFEIKPYNLRELRETEKTLDKQLNSVMKNKQFLIESFQDYEHKKWIKDGNAEYQWTTSPKYLVNSSDQQNPELLDDMVFQIELLGEDIFSESAKALDGISCVILDAKLDRVSENIKYQEKALDDLVTKACRICELFKY